MHTFHESDQFTTRDCYSSLQLCIQLPIMGLPTTLQTTPSLHWQNTTLPNPNKQNNQNINLKVLLHDS